MHHVRGFAILSIQFVLLQGFLDACVCSHAASAPACQRIAGTAVAFIGSVIDMEPDPLMPNAPGARVYRFEVERAYKGIPDGARQVIVNPDDGGDCRMDFRRGTPYLIFGSRMPHTDIVYSGECSGSRPVRYAAEDIQFLEQYAARKSRTEVFGKVLQWADWPGRPIPEEEMPIPGALVTLTGNSTKRTQDSGADGAFRFEDVDPGSYTIFAEGTPYGPGAGPISVTVAARGCAEVLLSLPARAELSGTLRTFNGSAAKNTEVQLLRRNPSGKWVSTSQFWKYTGKDGKFAFEDIPAGDYLLGYEIWGDSPDYDSPLDTQYYPGVRDRGQAAVLRLEPRQAIDNLSFRLPKPDTPRRIRAVVMWPDGRPVSHNLTQFFNRGELMKNLEGDHSDIFTFTGFEHRSYALSVRYWVDDLGGSTPGDQKWIAKSNMVKISPGKGPVTVKLILVQTLLADDDR